MPSIIRLFFRCLVLVLVITLAQSAYAEVKPVEDATQVTCTPGVSRIESTPMGTHNGVHDPTKPEQDECYNGIDDDGDGFTDFDANGAGDPQCGAPGQPMFTEAGENVSFDRLKVCTYNEVPVEQVDEDGRVSTECVEELSSCKEVNMRYAGCFAPNTQIVMADGSRKPIHQVKEGDLVLNPKTGQGIAVQTMVAGPESAAMIEIGLGKASIQVTQDHPMFVRQGNGFQNIGLNTRNTNGAQVKRASEITINDYILVADGSFQQAASVRKVAAKPGLHVYNLLLDTKSQNPEDRMILTGSGIITGDLKVQQQMAAGKAR